MFNNRNGSKKPTTKRVVQVHGADRFRAKVKPLRMVTLPNGSTMTSLRSDLFKIRDEQEKAPV